MEIVYDADGTQFLKMQGHRVSSQILPGRRAIIRTFDVDGELVEVMQVSRVWSIRRTRTA